MFLLAKVLTLVRISVKLTIFGEARSQKPARKDRFKDAELVRKNLKIFNLTTTNTIMMKLTKIMYLHKSVNQKPLGARNSVFWLNFQELLDYIKNYDICHAFPPQTEPHFGEYSIKNHPKQVQNDFYANY